MASSLTHDHAKPNELKPMCSSPLRPSEAAFASCHDRDAARISGDDSRASSRRRMPNGEADALGASVSGVSLREKWTDVSTSVRRSRVGEAGADWWAEERAKDIANRAR